MPENEIRSTSSGSTYQENLMMQHEHVLIQPYPPVRLYNGCGRWNHQAPGKKYQANCYC